MTDQFTDAHMGRVRGALPGLLLERNHLTALLMGVAAVLAILAVSTLDRAEAPDQSRKLPSCAVTALGDIASCTDELP